MPHEEARRRFNLAMRDLALGTGPLGERLDDAWLHLTPLQSHDLPEELRPAFEQMEAQWLSRAASELTEEESITAAEAILWMASALLTLGGPPPEQSTSSG